MTLDGLQDRFVYNIDTIYLPVVLVSEQLSVMSHMPSFHGLGSCWPYNNGPPIR